MFMRIETFTAKAKFLSWGVIGMRSQKVNSVCRFSLLVSLLLATWPSQLGIAAIISCVGSINSQSSHLAGYQRNIQKLCS